MVVHNGHFGQLGHGGVGMGLDSAYRPYPCHPKPSCAPCHLKSNKYCVLLNLRHPLTAAQGSACSLRYLYALRPQPKIRNSRDPIAVLSRHRFPQAALLGIPSVPELEFLDSSGSHKLQCAPRITEHTLVSCAPGTHGPPRCSTWNGMGRVPRTAGPECPMAVGL